MPFPAMPDQADKRGLFPVQDAALRARILPLFSFDPRATGERPLGHGTAFRVDPWGTCATAFHVVEDLLTVANGNAVLSKEIRLAALEFEVIAYGRVPLPKDSWRPFSGMFSICGIETPPVGTARVRNVTELAALSIARSADARGPTPFLPLDMRRWRPEPGQRVMALGFADLDIDGQGEGDARAMNQYLYGSLAIITEVQPPNGESSRPWPVFRVEAEWPGGMSGGPVFNDAGHVIGIVSTGLVGGGIATATSFSGWTFAERTFRTLDPDNPGMLRCWGAFDADDRLVTYAPARELLEPLVDEGKARVVRATALDLATGDYVLI
jgi:serine protease Do